MSALLRTSLVFVAAFACAVSPASAQVSRRTAVVEAVNKVKDGVLSLKVVKESDYGRKDVVGTGLIVDERGFGITNAHVVSGATSVTAVMWDKTEVECTVQACLPAYDLAIIRLKGEKKKYKALTIAPGNDLMVGEDVIAIGNPHGYANTVSKGIISALGREIEMPSGHTLSNLIQHSVGINPGNSGGPLVNINGEVIGINVALREGSQGIAFAINAETVKAVLAKHLAAAKVSNVEHGLSVTEKVKEEGEGRQQVVVKATAESAAKAGLKSGDVIVKLGSMTLANRFDVERAVWGYKGGDTITATVLRDGKKSDIVLTLGEAGTTTASAR